MPILQIENNIKNLMVRAFYSFGCGKIAQQNRHNKIMDDQNVCKNFKGVYSALLLQLLLGIEFRALVKGICNLTTLTNDFCRIRRIFYFCLIYFC